MTRIGTPVKDHARPGYEPFAVEARKRTVLNTVDSALKRRLPQPAYRAMLTGYHGIRVIARRNPGRGRILPDFVILGAAKAGTTSLYAWLGAHPDVVPARAKEIHYFSFHADRGTDWYRYFFPLEKDRARFAAAHGKPFITGEASPSYLPDRMAPRRLAGVIPDAALIVLLRDPVQRAYSQFQMRRRDGEEPLDSFRAAIEAEDRRLEPSITRSYLARGRYAEQLERWFEHFPGERFLIIALDDLAARPQATLDEVHEFLGLAPHTAADLKPFYAGSYEPLDAETEAWLTDYFRPHNTRLYALLGRDFGWPT